MPKIIGKAEDDEFKKLSRKVKEWAKAIK